MKKNNCNDPDIIIFGLVQAILMIGVIGFYIYENITFLAISYFSIGPMLFFVDFIRKPEKYSNRTNGRLLIDFIFRVVFFPIWIYFEDTSY